MEYYFEPVNLNQWPMFEKVKKLGHIEPFLATKSMSRGDVLLLHVGSQDASTKSGIYAIAEIDTEPFVLTNHPNDYCNGKLSVNAKFVRIDYNNPIINKDDCKKIISQFRTVHKLDADKYDLIRVLLGDSDVSRTVTEEMRECLKGYAHGTIFTTAEIKEMVFARFQREKNSVLPSDHCYNYTNKGIKPDSDDKFFMRIKHGEYKYVGENYVYNGVVEDARPHNTQVMTSYSRVLTVGKPEMTFHTITDALNFCFDAKINYTYQKGTYPLKKDVWKYYMAWFPNFAFYKEGDLVPGSNTLVSNWYNIINDEGTEITEYNRGEPKEKFEPEKNFYRLVFGRKKKEEYKFLGVFRMTSPYEDGINYAYT